MMNTLRYASTIVLLACVLALTIPVLGQQNNADGEFCVRAFEDSSGNGLRDLNEAPLQGGISANLLDGNGIIIASALLDNSPTLARGLICFQFLPTGQYSIEVVSADFRATTASVMTNVVQAGEVPYVMDFGAHRIPTNPTVATEIIDTEISEAKVMRVVVAVAGAVGAVIMMSLIGFLIYLIVYRNRLRREMQQMPAEPYYQRPPTTGSTPRVTDTGEYRRK
ncbi:MAG: hypothetical protein H7X77_09580 [Anaerolineae bacterium]|nr:hypothetical protein [Anaerolineae bacterium]